MMTKEEIVSRIEYLKHRRSMHVNKSTWNGDDYEYDGELLNEILNLTAQLSKIEEKEMN